MPIELRLLRHAAAVAEHGSFGQAAKALHLTQSALSRSVAHLEDTLEVKLFDRGTRQIMPTAIGKLLLERGEHLLRNATDLVQEIKSSKGLGIGELKVGSAMFPEEISAGKAVARLIASYPRLHVHLVVGDIRDLARAVLAGEIELALMETTPAEVDPRFNIELVGQHKGSFFCSSDHPLASEQSPSLEQVLAYPLACGRITERVAKFLAKLNLQGHFEPDTGDFLPAIRVDSISATKQAVLTGGAVAWAPFTLLREEVERGGFHAIPLDLPWAHLNYGFVTLRGRVLSLSAQAFMDEVRKIEADVLKAETEHTTSRPIRRRIWKSAAKRRRKAHRASRS